MTVSLVHALSTSRLKGVGGVEVGRPSGTSLEQYEQIQTFPTLPTWVSGDILYHGSSQWAGASRPSWESWESISSSEYLVPPSFSSLHPCVLQESGWYVLQSYV